MSDETSAPISLEARLDKTSMTATGSLDPSLREDLRAGLRGDARLSLNSVSLMAATPAAAVNVTPPVPLYSRSEAPEQAQAPSAAFDLTAQGSDASAMAAGEAADDADSVLALLGAELGLDFQSVDNSAVSPYGNDKQKADLAVILHDEVALIINDVEDELDITQLDIY